MYNRVMDNKKDNFTRFIKNIKTKIEENEGKVGNQKDQFELMYSLERKFQFYICKTAQGKKVYKKFILHVKRELGSILKAKGFFREKKDVFSMYISKAIRDDKPLELQKYKLNYNLASFIIDHWEGKLPKYVDRYYKELTRARAILIENNTPLAINRANKFYNSQKRTELELTDFVSICMCGLITGIDKFVGKYSKNLIGVSIGRMVGFMIKENSKTFIRMYPSDHKIMYRANSIRKRLNITDIGKLTKAVIESFKIDKTNGVKVPSIEITELYIESLLGASRAVSVYNSDPKTDVMENRYDVTADINSDVEKGALKKERYLSVASAIQQLSVLDRKIIRLTGVTL